MCKRTAEIQDWDRKSYTLPPTPKLEKHIYMHCLKNLDLEFWDSIFFLWTCIKPLSFHSTSVKAFSLVYTSDCHLVLVTDYNATII